MRRKYALLLVIAAAVAIGGTSAVTLAAAQPAHENSVRGPIPVVRVSDTAPGPTQIGIRYEAATSGPTLTQDQAITTAGAVVSAAWTQATSIQVQHVMLSDDHRFKP